MKFLVILMAFLDEQDNNEPSNVNDATVTAKENIPKWTITQGSGLFLTKTLMFLWQLL